MTENINELREAEIDEQREAFESSCQDIIASMVGWGSIVSRDAFRFDYDEVIYLNGWTDALWQCYIKGWKSQK